METGTLPLKFIISSHRLNNLDNILKRNKEETLVRVFNAQKDNPLNGDFIFLVKKDLDLIGQKYDEKFIKSMNKLKFKKFVKKHIRKAAFQMVLASSSTKQSSQKNSLVKKSPARIVFED